VFAVAWTYVIGRVKRPNLETDMMIQVNTIEAVLTVTAEVTGLLVSWVNASRTTFYSTAHICIHYVVIE